MIIIVCIFHAVLEFDSGVSSPSCSDCIISDIGQYFIVFFPFCSSFFLPLYALMLR